MENGCWRGLDQDYLGKPFEPGRSCWRIAEYITKTLAICMVCGAPANHTQRLGWRAANGYWWARRGTYEGACLRCFDPMLVV